MARAVETDLLEQVGDLARRAHWDGLVEMLVKAPGTLVRRKAMEALLASRTQDAFDLLADAAAGPEMGLNEEIIQHLRDIPGETSLRALGRVLSSESTLRRAFVVTHLAKREEPMALTMLLRAARDPSGAVARIAERALVARSIDDPAKLAALPRESIAGIVAFLPFESAQELVGEDFPVAVRAEALRRLGSSGGEDSVTTLMACVADPEPLLARAAWDGLRAVKGLPAPSLFPFLADRNEEVRRGGVELFARSCGAEGAPILAGLLRDKAPAVREATVRAIHQLQKGASVPALAKLAADPEARVRRAVIGALAPYAEATGELTAAALREEGELRELALEALSRHRVFRPELADLYLGFLEHHAAQVKTGAEVLDAMAAIAAILGDAHEPRALAGFAALCRSTSRRLRRTGLEAILRYPPELRGDVLVELAETHDKNMLATLAMTLAESKDPRAVVPLIRTYVECSGRSVRRAHEYLLDDERLRDTDFLLNLLTHKSGSVRRYAAQNLKSCKDARVVEPLLKVSHDEDVEVQLAAIEALGGFARTDATVADRLIEVCNVGDVTVRQAAVEALGDAQVEAAVPVLVKALYNVFLRPRAEEALKKVGGRQGYLAMKRLKRREVLFGSRYKKRKVKPKLKD